MCSRLLVAAGCWLLVVVVVVVVVVMMMMMMMIVVVFLVSKCGRALNENHKLHCSWLHDLRAAAASSPVTNLFPPLNWCIFVFLKFLACVFSINNWVSRLFTACLVWLSLLYCAWIKQWMTEVFRCYILGVSARWSYARYFLGKISGYFWI